MATRLVGREGRAAFEAGELRTLERWIAALPPDARESDLEIASLEAWSRFYTGDLAGGAAIAARATATPGDRSAARGRLLVLLALVGTTMRPDAESLARDGIELVGDDDLFRSLGLQAAGLAQLARGDVAGSLETLRAAFDAAEASGLPIAVLPAVNPLGHALVATGRRDEAERGGPAGARGAPRPARRAARDRLARAPDARDRALRGRRRRGGPRRARTRAGRRRVARGGARGARLGAAGDRPGAPGDRGRPWGARHPRARACARHGLPVARWGDGGPNPPGPGRSRLGVPMGGRGPDRGARGVAAARHAPRLDGHDRGQGQARRGPARRGAASPGDRPRDVRSLGHGARP